MLPRSYPHQIQTSLSLSLLSLSLCEGTFTMQTSLSVTTGHDTAFVELCRHCNIYNMKHLQHTFEIVGIFEITLATRVYSHCNTCNTQIKNCNIHLKQLKYLKHAPEHSI
jgi:hypothetical protein